MRYLLVLTTDAATSPAAALQQYTVELIRAGVLLADELLAEGGLVVELGVGGPPAPSDLRTGPACATALWILQASDQAEAAEWARRMPLDRGRVEVRRIVSDAAMHG